MSVEVSTREQSERAREKENECGGAGGGDCVIPTPRPAKDGREVVNSSSWSQRGLERVDISHTRSVCRIKGQVRTRAESVN